MFMYASTLGIALSQGRKMFAEPDLDFGKTFKLQHTAVQAEAKKWQAVGKSNDISFDATLMHLPLKNFRIRGYLQSFLYFADVVDEVRREFTFHDYIANDAAKILRDVYIQYKPSSIVGVNSRRGDFLSKNSKIAGYGVPDKSYFMKAFNLVKSMLPDKNITFLVASDDLPWCRQNLLTRNVVIMPEAPAAVHLAALSSCEHVIISGGTFGWWAGWLANGHVIYNTGYMEKGTRLGNLFNRSQYYPKTWIGLGN